MNDINAFENLVADVADDLMGPSRPFDTATIVQSAKAVPPRRRWTEAVQGTVGDRFAPSAWGFTMFSAVKFVVAAAIVALFGGFLLAGVLTAPQGDEMAPAAVSESPSPMTTEELLSVVVAEEVTPGVLRIDTDGVRSLWSAGNRDIVAGYDGGIWLLREDGFLRLGVDESHGWPTGVGPEDHIFEVAPDGTMWVIPNTSPSYPDLRRGAGLRSADGEEWTVQPCPEDCVGFTVAPDGTAWASWVDWDGTGRVGHLGSTGWQSLDGYIPNGHSFDRLIFADAGDLYGVEGSWVASLYRYENATWHRTRQAYELVDVGPDGTVWQDGGVDEETMRSFPGDGLARYAEGEWAEWTSADLPDIRLGVGIDHQFMTAPDGSLWFSLWRSDDDFDPRGSDDWRSNERISAVAAGRVACDGVARFDGETLDRFLPRRCISMDIAADGSAWVLADEEEGGVLYVITPQAVAATE